ncbi:MAG: hypothetical protein KGQ83_08220 [Planctomycetes bacterium]|nr:hypothetical protein [Planctomycetota bacterium]MDE1890589.1 hypothetical protein [Planctomycetota bacterium]
MVLGYFFEQTLNRVGWVKRSVFKNEVKMGLLRLTPLIPTKLGRKAGGIVNVLPRGRHKKQKQEYVCP